MQTKEMVLCAVFAAILCIFSCIAIPIGAVPITLGVLGVSFCAVVLGRQGVLSVIIFILLGAMGLPVFSGLSGGVHILLGPTGGYIWGYIPMCLFIGTRSEKNHSPHSALRLFGVCLLGLLICYLFGTVQFVFLTKKVLGQALLLCVFPFIGFDLCKCAFATLLGIKIRNRLRQNGIL